MHLEDELLRSHFKVMQCAPPPTVCSYLLEKLKGWQKVTQDKVTCDQSEKGEVGRETGTVEEDLRQKHLLESCLTDIWDKVYSLKVPL